MLIWQFSLYFVPTEKMSPIDSIYFNRALSPADIHCEFKIEIAGGCVIIIDRGDIGYETEIRVHFEVHSYQENCVGRCGVERSIVDLFAIWIRLEHSVQPGNEMDLLLQRENHKTRSDLKIEVFTASGVCLITVLQTGRQPFPLIRKR